MKQDYLAFVLIVCVVTQATLTEASVWGFVKDSLGMKHEGIREDEMTCYRTAEFYANYHTYAAADNQVPWPSQDGLILMEDQQLCTDGRTYLQIMQAGDVDEWHALMRQLITTQLNILNGAQISESPKKNIAGTWQTAYDMGLICCDLTVSTNTTLCDTTEFAVWTLLFTQLNSGKIGISCPDCECTVACEENCTCVTPRDEIGNCPTVSTSYCDCTIPSPEETMKASEQICSEEEFANCALQGEFCKCSRVKRKIKMQDHKHNAREVGAANLTASDWQVVCQCEECNCHKAEMEANALMLEAAVNATDANTTMNTETIALLEEHGKCPAGKICTITDLAPIGRGGHENCRNWHHSDCDCAANGGCTSEQFCTSKMINVTDIPAQAVREDNLTEPIATEEPIGWHMECEYTCLEHVNDDCPVTLTCAPDCFSYTFRSDNNKCNSWCLCPPIEEAEVIPEEVVV